jgi:hypothetical protein
VRGAGRAYQAQSTSPPDQTDVSLLINTGMKKTDPAGQEVKKSDEAAVKINGKAENIADKTSVKKSYRKKATETVKKLDNRVGEKNVKGKDATASPKNLAESNDSLLNQPDKTEGVTVVKSNPAAKAEQRASMSPPVGNGPPPAKESSTGDVNKKRPASADDGDTTKEKNTKGKKKLKATGSAVVENGTAEEREVKVGQGARKRKKDSQLSDRVKVETTGPPVVAGKRPASGEEEQRKLGKKVKTLPAPALAAQVENNTGKKTLATAVSTAPSVGKKAAAVVSNSATLATVVKQEPAATDNGGGDQEGDRGPESGGGPPVVRLPTYTHMIKQALAGKD